MKLTKYYSQFGEDKILNKIFNKKNGVCVEVGGFDGVTGSNTYFFETLGWRSLIVEPMPDFCKKIKDVRTCEVVEVAASNRSGEVDFYIASGVETLSTLELDPAHFARIQSLSDQAIKKITVKTARLDDILAEREIGEIDFMTIDVEGHEILALSGMSFTSIVPRILIIEDNTDGGDSAVMRLMRQFSYVRFKRTGCNDWYAKTDDPLVNSLGVAWVELQIFFGSYWRLFKSTVKKIANLKN